MYKSVKLYFRLKLLAQKLKKEKKQINFISDLQDKNYVLIVDTKIPEYDKDSGSRRLTEIIKLLTDNQIGVYLLSDYKEYRYKLEYVSFFKEMGVVVYEPSLDNYGNLIKKNDFLKLILPKVTFAWLHRPDIFEKYYPIIKKYNPSIKVFFDMVDFHYLRFKRESELYGNAKIMKKAQKFLDLEINNCQKADKIIVISEMEKQNLKKYYDNDDKTIAIGNIHEYSKNIEFKNFKDRKDLLFIGGFDHKPNIDAVQYLFGEIMPLLWKTKPDISINIIGSNVPLVIEQLNSEKFRILGYVEDVAPYFLNSKVFVAPLRYGAGIKGKIGQSLEYGLPLVTTHIGAEGFDFGKNEKLLVGNNKQEIVNSIISLYENEELWKQISDDSEKVIEPFSVFNIESKIMGLFN
ncbi:glycosyltransferase family 4 protein [Flavobacterium fluviatile]|uniref:glycosyltransferase family 4 protein n=1 Tax=Flavobacterium fluviatile TaxID=1862387 RepID=UPI0013D4D0DF|nr:glycosyltransferase family 4 protein [Flavobacterium fluviatile]